MSLFLTGILALMAVGASSQRPEDILVRLVGGKNKYEGKVEIRYQGKWKGVCDHYWGVKEARAACRMAGFPDAERYTKGLHFGYGTTGYWMDDVRCDDNRYSLLECRRNPWGKHNCRSDSPAGVVCKSADEDVKLGPQPSKASGKVSDLEVRLRKVGAREEDQTSEGMVLVRRGDRWGYICPTNWGYNEARVTCGQLGFPDSVKSELHRVEARNPTYWMDKVTCSGTESSLVSCDHKGWGPFEECEEGRYVVYVNCSRSVTHKVFRVHCK